MSLFDCQCGAKLKLQRTDKWFEFYCDYCTFTRPLKSRIHEDKSFRISSLDTCINIIPQGRGPQVSRSEHEVSEVESLS